MKQSDSLESVFRALKIKNTKVVIDDVHYRIAAFIILEMERKVEAKPIDLVSQIEAIAHNQNIGILSEMTEVYDVGPSLQSPEELNEARTYFTQQNHIPAIWHHYLKTGKHPPFHFERTSFVNLFCEDTIILYDIYRPPWKPYYTSDVFFYQWLNSLGKGIDLLALPNRFPTTVYVHNITNHISKNSLKVILDSGKTDTYVINNPMDKDWNRISTTPHLKTIHHILNTYNKINGMRGESMFKISSLQLYRNTEMYHLKLNFSPG